jgi:hypothetical protein
MISISYRVAAPSLGQEPDTRVPSLQTGQRHRTQASPKKATARKPVAISANPMNHDLLVRVKLPLIRSCTHHIKVLTLDHNLDSSKKSPRAKRQPEAQLDDRGSRSTTCSISAERYCETTFAFAFCIIGEIHQQSAKPRRGICRSSVRITCLFYLIFISSSYVPTWRGPHWLAASGLRPARQSSMLYLRAPSYLFHETLDPATQHRPPPPPSKQSDLERVFCNFLKRQ